MIRRWLQRHRPGRRRQRIYDWIVAYCVPTWAWQRWSRWYWKSAKSYTFPASPEPAWDPANRPEHNHITRDIKPQGQCLEC